MVLKFLRDLDVPAEKVNVNGGAIALGHPLGATGAMILGTLIDELERRDQRYGLATLCVGGGMGVATIVERDLSPANETRSRPLMSQNMIRWDVDADGIVTLTMDDPGQRANTMNADLPGLDEADGRPAVSPRRTRITGVIVTSAKDTFFAGGDLRLLSQVTDDTAAEFFAGVTA